MAAVWGHRMVSIESIVYHVHSSEIQGWDYYMPARVTCLKVNEYYSHCIPEGHVTTNTAGSTVYLPSITQAPLPGCTPTGTITAGALQPRATSISLVAMTDGQQDPIFRKLKAVTLRPLDLRQRKGCSLQIEAYPNPTSCTPFLYFNIDPIGTDNWPLLFESTGTTLGWNFYDPDDTLSSSGSKGINKFVACSNGTLYFQWGPNLPSGNCTVTRLKIGQ
ncbi:Fungal cellulose binding domain protein [Rhizoctonia solani]|uniref:Fungal cellulose binding domain protein n=1 Tax=Rhizoctonia solani TaxID=456999 RepID=A0A8H8SYX2_9AGAM|nr:Fungal cellulose binding domain protein [Rhizoctonia solani]QRW21793.1 Fungal cellulose binding domain protein [Rhizoctonia solani]